MFRKAPLFLIVVIMLCFALPKYALAEESDSSEAIYSVDENGCLTLKADAHIPRDLVIPDNVNGVAVTSIADDAFLDSLDCRSLVIPEGVTAIGNRAFKGCRFIGEISLPESLELIGSSAFEGCGSLIELNIPRNVTSIGEAAFMGCDYLNKLSIAEGISELPRQAFYECSRLKSVHLPDSLTQIGEEAFSRCIKLQGIDLPCGVESIGKAAFKDCDSLLDFLVPEGVLKIEAEAFEGCHRLICVYIPQTLSYLGRSAFSNCYYLSEIYYGGSEDAWRALAKNAEYSNKTEVIYNSDLLVIERMLREAGDRIIDIAVSTGMTLGLKADGTVRFAGFLPEAKKDISTWSDIIRLYAGHGTVAGVRSDGTVLITSLKDYSVSDWTGIASVYMGSNYIAALSRTGIVLATGDNSFGQCNVSYRTDIKSIKTVGSESSTRTLMLSHEGVLADTNGFEESGVLTFASNGDLIVMHKSDGSIKITGENSEDYTEALDDWRDISQLEICDSMVLGLKNDGTVLSFSPYASANDIATWSKVSKIYHDGECVILGLKDDGTVVATHLDGKDLPPYDLNLLSFWTGIEKIAIEKDHIVGLSSDGTLHAVGDNKLGDCNISDW